ncbi:hypothetical protein O3P69_013539, partial [Scylla paramamosain]
QVGGSDGGGGGSGGEVDGRDRGAVQAADIKEKRNARTSKVLFGSLILDLLGLKVVLPLCQGPGQRRHREALEKFGRGLLHHPRLRNMLPPDAPRPVRATRHHNRITPLKAPRTDRYRLSAIPTMPGVNADLRDPPQAYNCQLGTHLHCDAAPWRWRAGCLRGSGNTRGSQRLASGFGRREEPGVSSSLRAQEKHQYSVIKIVDFGFAHLMPDKEKDGSTKTPCFTVHYAAPEVLLQAVQKGANGTA